MRKGIHPRSSRSPSRRNRSIVGFMLESNLAGGRQDVPADRSRLVRGVSITDACIDWPTTEGALREAAERLCRVLPARRVSGAA